MGELQEVKVLRPRDGWSEWHRRVRCCKCTWSSASCGRDLCPKCGASQTFLFTRVCRTRPRYEYDSTNRAWYNPLRWLIGNTTTETEVGLEIEWKDEL